MKNESVIVRPQFVAGLFLTLLGFGAGGCGGKPDAPQLGVTHAAVTEAIGPELTSQGDIIAKVTHPNGGGSCHLETIRDGVAPPVGSTDSSQQYDTYDSNAVPSAKTDDWVGYRYGGPVTFSRVVFQEGVNFPDGGWFTTLNVQVLQGANWVTVPGMVATPAYRPDDGSGFDTYRLDFPSVTGTAIRIEGPPGGASQFISVAELRVWAAPGTSGPPPAPTLGPDLTALAKKPLAMPGDPVELTPGGNHYLQTIREAKAMASCDPALQNQSQYNSYAADPARTQDWVGYEFDTTQFFGQVVFQTGKTYPDGGWFETLTVQVRQNGTWVPVSGLNLTPDYPTDGSSPNFKSYVIRFVPIGGDAIRLFGQPGGTARFISVASLTVHGDNPCQGRADGTACDDGDLCTVGDRCLAGTCQPLKPYDCAASNDECRKVGVCDRATGRCSQPIAADGTGCSDRNRCTVNDTCLGGTCMPGAATACSGPNDTFYYPLTNLGSFQGQTVATGINDDGLVVGNDTPGHDASTVARGAGNIRSTVFRWSEATGKMTYDDAVGPDNFALGLNASGQITGVVGTRIGDGWLGVLRADSQGHGAEVLDAAWGAAINDSGVIAGQGYITTNPIQHRVVAFRMGMDNQPEVLETAPTVVGNMAMNAIDSLGNVVGYSYLADGTPIATGSLGGNGIQLDLNDFLYGDLVQDWRLIEATVVRTDESSGNETILGWGTFRGTPHAFQMTLTGDGAFKELADLHSLSPYDQDNSYVHLPVPSSMNADGVIVGAYWDKYRNWPHEAIVWIPGEESIHNLNDYLDPDPKNSWHLTQAISINNHKNSLGQKNPEVVGFGYVDGEARAFMMKLPDLTPCPAVDSCHQAPLRNLVTGQCSALPQPALADGTECSDSHAQCPNNNYCVAGVCGGDSHGICLRMDGIVDTGNGQLTAVFGYDSAASTPVTESANEVSLNGSVVANPSPMPPAVFRPNSHPGAFMPRFQDGQIVSWRINGQIVRASSANQPLPNTTPNTGHITVEVDHNPIAIDNEPNHFLKPPDPPAFADGPLKGDVFNGTIDGKLAITPSGAATYTVPISIPPGIGGMAPDISLVYNSQAGDGIAGQGWDLTALSMIVVRPNSRLLDGTGSYADGGYSLDGKRLITISPFHFMVESRDFSEIVLDNDHFVVTSKTGEIRYYGRSHASRVFDFSNAKDVVWLLDRVVDTWGNYYDLFYNEDLAAFSLDKGIRLKRIDYTGHMDQYGTTDQDPFYRITFEYQDQDRKDVRHFRISGAWIPRNARLASITVSSIQPTAASLTRKYTLGYVDDDPTYFNPSLLQTIDYCVSQTIDGMQKKTCANQLFFDWDFASYGWDPAPASFNPKARLDWSFDSGSGMRKTKGAQYVDLNGDGLLDFVVASNVQQETWKNNGNGFEAAPANWVLPITLVQNNGLPNGAFFVDMDGDGILDLVAPGIAGYDCDSQCNSTSIFTGCSPDHDDQGRPTCEQERQMSPGVWLNRLRTNEGWIPKPEYTQLPNVDGWGLTPGLNFNKGDTLIDMDGDGKADLVRITKDWALYILRNTGIGWEVLQKRLTPGFNIPVGNSGGPDSFSPAFHLEDMNRDGLPDLVADDPNRTYENVDLNSGIFNTAVPAFVRQFGSLIRPKTTDGTRVFGDIDGDGAFDSTILFAPEIDEDCPPPRCDDVGCDQPPPCTIFGAKMKAPQVALATNHGFWDAGAAAYKQAILDVAPGAGAISDTVGFADYYFSLADLNGDGLADLILNHDDGGQVLMNTGTEWRRINGDPGFHHSAGGEKRQRLPVVPTDDKAHGYVGAMFVDLNGDGVTDLVQSNASGAHAWINAYRPPIIKEFPNSLARKTEVAYKVITTAEGKATTYDESSFLDQGTMHMIAPLLVVASVSEEDGRAIGQVATTTYQYSSLRGSSRGRGPQGFMTMTVTDPSGLVTSTTFSQAFPFTGLPTSVIQSRPQPGFASYRWIAGTQTDYCYKVFKSNLDGDIQQNGEVCRLAGDFGAGPEIPTKTGLFVYPKTVTMASYSWSETPSLKNDGHIGGVPRLLDPTRSPFADPLVLTTTVNQYDAHGNATSVIMTSVGPEETIQKATTNTFGTDGSRQQKEGKVTAVTTTTTRLAPTDSNDARRTRTHSSAFVYKELNPSPTPPFGPFPMVKKQIELGAGEPIEQHTAYEYDRFGNVITTTVCPGHFAKCEPGAYVSPPRPVGDPPPGPGVILNQQQFRTIRVSYTASDFAPTSGLIATLPYGDGRFPVRKTNGFDHREYMAYDPDRGGGLLQLTDANGVTTCNGYDVFGRKTSETARCGSNNPITTSTAVTYLTRNFPAADEFPTVTVTTAAGGATTWVYNDVLGRARETLTRAFDGGFIRSAKTFNNLGRPYSETAPHLDGGDIRFTVFQFDSQGRIDTVTKDLGKIDNFGNAQSIVRTTYDGFASTTKHVEGGSPSHQRTEKKNVLGKVASVVDALGNTISYLYDADGNLTDVMDPFQTETSNHLHIEYDGNGRRRSVTDPDLGNWQYTYDGFGELETQTDARQQKTSITYDILGRMVAKEDGSGESARWIYDNAVGAGKGRLAATISTPNSHLNNHCMVEGLETVPGNRTGRWYHYTQYGEIAEEFECVDGDIFSVQYGYDEAGRQDVTRYPLVKGERFGAKKHFTNAGYLQYVADENDNTVYWAATEMNALGQVTREKLRNGVETASQRNEATGWLMGATATSHLQSNMAIQDWSFDYDTVGNLRHRKRSDALNVADSLETFTYDALDRLKTSMVELVGRQGASADAFDYDATGNLTLKTGNILAYTGCGERPHAVCSYGPGGALFSYDENGNMIAGRGRTASYNSFNKVANITGETASVDYVYGPDDYRVMQIVNSTGSSPSERTVYVGLGATGRSLYERRRLATGVFEHTQFIYAGGTHNGNAFALKIVTDDGSTIPSTSTRYYHFDHLGSISAISDEAGNVPDPVRAGSAAGVIGYEAWGGRRNSDGTSASSSSLPLPAGHRGFTGHETIPGIGLVNMNGRVYDPELGRFLSADPNVQFIGDLQSYNRYTYVLNNPLRYTDPTGYFLDGGYTDFFVNLSITIVAVAVCVGSEGSGCGLSFLMLAAVYNGASMANSGASAGQIVAATMINLVAGTVGGAVGGAVGQNLTGRIVGGAVAGAIGGAMSTAISGRGDSLGRSIFMGAFEGAAMAAYSYGIQQETLAARSQAQGGGGSDGTLTACNGPCDVGPHPITREFDIPVVKGAGEVRGELFIKQAAVDVGVSSGQGDGRDFDPAPNPVHSRVVIDLDFENGHGVVQANPSCQISGQCLDPLPWGKGNSLKINIAEATVRITGKFTNSILPWGPSIDFSISVTARSWGVTYFGVWEKYPSFELTRTYNSSTQVLTNLPETSPFCLAGICGGGYFHGESR